VAAGGAAVSSWARAGEASSGIEDKVDRRAARTNLDIFFPRKN
jgi:hypothetical protein